MIAEIFAALSQALAGSFGIALLAALAWGVFSILLSPCHLSSIPLIIGYINTKGQVSTKRSFNLSAIFALGVLITIALIGVVTAALGRLLGDVGTIGNLLVAGVFLVIGLYLMDVLRFSWEAGPKLQTRLKGIAGAMALGLLFGVGLGPCTFACMAPVLGTVFHLSQTSIIQANSLLLAFGLGHVAVIVGAGSFGNWVQRYLNWTDNSRGLVIVKRICGALVLAGGIYLIANTV
ncbi:MAG: cytochrome c biogenesis protein CcdA [candidate division KSB1 bacterium]|nr:cytochrome c biogenesis protein CcdA [candidate division KSB1 bacterium]MDZ7276461.1 cytochrome c biogenesis protein CcdA [candidate division KSB1 bacterium]MDZ7288130.1 cytochrome c biogenesis protein CcdA [candidate division KSB1 bacterium]MDZ7300231.1 cytochrome c biogenesis protein CcdA [candidate division KSB1 bacterium]MDZ7309124.1 cytochrome c biogenesis protein CcdA [candidate division KSB1 bacterium]